MGIPGILVAAVASYLLGAVPVGFLLVKALRGQDIRTVGSGNVGATNAGRVMGKKWFFIVYILDFSKGLIPCLVVGTIVGYGWPSPAPFEVVLCGVLAVVGHIWPIYLRLRGGKGVATSCGVCVYLLPVGLLIGLVVFVICTVIWRYVSLASIVGTVTVGAFVWWTYRGRLHDARYTLGFVTLAVAMIVFRHRGNIGRLLKGTESKIGRRPEPPKTEDDTDDS